jgi:uncharacterized protein (TIGR03067 family)
MYRLLLAGFVLIPAGALSAPVPKALKRTTDDTQIVGEWETSPEATSVWIFRADGTAGVGDPANPACKALYKIDPTQSPKHLDWSQDEGQSWYFGVYELDGDELRISFGRATGGPRPPNVDKQNGFQFVGVTRRGKGS